MKYLILAGGGGTRFWPISRDNFPKQFVKIFDGKSTFQLTVERLQGRVDPQDVYVCTNKKFKDLILENAPHLLPENLLFEPYKRDIAPALGMALVRLRKSGYTGPVAVLWADHIIQQVDEFVRALKFAGDIVANDEAKIALIGKKPSFANPNLGWIHKTDIGKSSDGLYGLKGFVYKPEPLRCEGMFKSGKWLWNTGYYVADVDYLLGVLEKYTPDLYKGLVEIENIIGHGTEDEQFAKVTEIYEQFEPISSDNAIIYNVPHEDVRVLEASFDWEDPGTLHAYKKFHERSDENYIYGEGIFYSSEDSMIYNTSGRKIVCLGLKGVDVVEMDDVTYIVHKDAVVKTSDMLKQLKAKKGYKELV